MHWRRQHKSWVAVDRGACSFRAIQLVFDEGGPRIAHWINVETPPGPAAQEAASDAGLGPSGPPALAAGLAQFGTRRAGLVVDSPDVDYCLLQVPEAVLAQNAQLVAQAIRWEVGRQLTWPVEEAELAAWPLPAPMGSGSNAMAVAARRANIVSTVEMLESQRMDCECVEPAAPALVRACRGTSQCQSGEIWGVLDLGHTANRLYLAVDSAVAYARNVRGAGHAWTEAIARELRIDCHVAEQYKRKYGIGSDPRGCRMMMGAMEPLGESALPGVLLAVLKTTLADLVSDVERAFRFLMEQYPQRQPGALVLAGGGSRMPGLAQWIAKELGIRVTPAASERPLQIDASNPLAKPANYAVMAGCIGLALAEMES
jgi:Tfp pilus assembly PilM family ATPase